MCILIVFGVVITNKKNSFTTRSDRDQRQIKEIADTLLIFNLSFMQEKKTYIWVSKHVVSPLKGMKLTMVSFVSREELILLLLNSIERGN